MATDLTPNIYLLEAGMELSRLGGEVFPDRRTGLKSYKMVNLVFHEIKI